MRKTNLLHALLLLFTVTLYFGCRKADIPDISQPKQLDRFFTISDATAPEIKAIVQSILKQDEQFHFIKELSAKAGFPRWDKAILVDPNSAAPNRGASEGDSLYYIPFVKDSAADVNALLLVKAGGADTAYKLIYKQQYADYGFDTTQTEHWNAQDLFQVFAQFDYWLFAHETFTITDGRIFGREAEQQLTVSLERQEDNQRAVQDCKTCLVAPVSYCLSVTACEPYLQARISNSADIATTLGPGDCSTTTSCYTLYTEVSGASGGTTSGGGGGTWYNTNPCPTTTTPIAREDLLAGTEPIDGGCTGSDGAWTPTNGTTVNVATLYPELDKGITDASAVTNLKTQYYALGKLYKSRPVDQYTSMSRDQFLNMLKNNPSLAATIDPVTILAKIGINAASDVLTQVFFIKLTDNSVTTWSQAFGKVDWWQVAATAATSIIPWRTPEGKFLIAAVNGAAASINDLTKYGFKSWVNSGRKFVEGFCGSLIGSYLTDVASRFGGINNFGRALVTKLDDYFPYRTVTKWLGGGLRVVVETLNTSVGPLSSVKKMVGWGSGKVCIVGRNMSGRVIPYAKAASAIFFDESNPLAKPYFNQAIKDEWNLLTQNGTVQLTYTQVKSTLWYKANQQFIRDLKAQGYTFIDLGHGGFPPGTSAFYDMELYEIF